MACLALDGHFLTTAVEVCPFVIRRHVDRNQKKIDLFLLNDDNCVGDFYVTL
jgi:hypothetical protein